MKESIAMSAKRIIDVLLSLVALIVLSPLLALIALAVKISSPGPVFFRQQRVGLYGKLFRILKFRSMVAGADRNGPVTYLADPRITRVGRLLRLTSLDELPQLINVLRGEMSLVGPRPLLPYSITPEESWRQTVKPGCTSLTVVNGRQSLDWNERLRVDQWYVENRSLWLDFRILLLTIPVVLLRKNVYDLEGEMKVRPLGY
jgi:lipopolysaccharide/colanic/teichoic acid biosynthesis glycosyltransferase